jgi:hypothetical protein
MARSVEQMQEHLHEVSDEELARLIDTVKVKPPPPPAVRLKPARMGMSQDPVKSSLVLEMMVRKLREKWGKIG